MPLGMKSMIGSLASIKYKTKRCSMVTKLKPCLKARIMIQEKSIIT